MNKKKILFGVVFILMFIATIYSSSAVIDNRLFSTTHTILSGYTDPKSTIVIDWDKDGDMDILVGSNSNNYIYLLINEGNFNFTAKQLNIGRAMKFSFDVEDFNNDGYYDIVFPSGDYSYIYINNGDDTFTQSDYYYEDDARFCHVADIDNDGDIDYLCTSDDDNEINKGINNGAGSFINSRAFLVTDPYDFDVGDVDNDGDIDVAVVGYGGDNIVIGINDGTGIFTIYSFVQNNPELISLCDIDGDGYKDIITSDIYLDNLYWWKNDGTGTSYTQYLIDTNENGFSFECYDVDNDGDNDILSINGVSPYNYIDIYENDGNENFTKYNRTISSSTLVYYININDFDNDGDIDIVVPSTGDGAVYIQESTLILSPKLYVRNSYTNEFINFTYESGDMIMNGTSDGILVDYLDVYDVDPTLFISYNELEPIDYSLNNITIINNNVSDSHEDCEFLHCGLFDGSTSYLNLTNNTDLNIGTSDFSFAWCGKTDMNKEQTIYQDADLVNLTGLRIYWGINNELKIEISNGTDKYICNSGYIGDDDCVFPTYGILSLDSGGDDNYCEYFNDGNLNCYAITIDRDGVVRYYKNGEYISECNSLQPLANYSINTSSVYIGTSGDIYWYNGTIDEFYFTKSILPLDKILLLNKSYIKNVNFIISSDGYITQELSRNLNVTTIIDLYQSFLSPVVQIFGSQELITEFNMTINGKTYGTTAELNAGTYNVTITTDQMETYPKTFELTIPSQTTYSPTLEIFSKHNLTLNFKNEDGDVVSNVDFNIYSDYCDNITDSTTTGTFTTDIKGWCEYRITYSATGYYDKTYYFKTDYENINLTLYLTDENDASEINAYVRDEFSNPVEDAEIRVYRYDENTNSYVLSEIEKTNFEGQTVLHLIKTTIYYKFMIYYDGQLKKETNPTKIYEDDIYFYISLDTTNVGDDYFKIGDLQYELVFNEDTNNFRYTYTDDSSAITKGCLKVWRVNALGNNLVGEQCINSASGTILINVENITGATYKATSYVEFNDVMYYVATIYHTFEQEAITTNLGIFGILILMFIIVFVGYWNPIIMLILSPLPLVVGAFTGILNLTVWWAIPIYVIAILLAIVIHKRS